MASFDPSPAQCDEDEKSFTPLGNFTTMRAECDIRTAEEVQNRVIDTLASAAQFVHQLLVQGDLPLRNPPRRTYCTQRHQPVTRMRACAKAVLDVLGADRRVRTQVMPARPAWVLVRRGYDAATLSVYRQETQAAQAAGGHDRVADWTTRHQQIKDRRHQRLYGSMSALTRPVPNIPLDAPLLQMNQDGTISEKHASLIRDKQRS